MPRQHDRPKYPGGQVSTLEHFQAIEEWCDIVEWVAAVSGNS